MTMVLGMLIPPQSRDKPFLVSPFFNQLIGYSKQLVFVTLLKVFFEPSDKDCECVGHIKYVISPKSALKFFWIKLPLGPRLIIPYFIK